jgi:hypothetical protein
MSPEAMLAHPMTGPSESQDAAVLDQGLDQQAPLQLKNDLLLVPSVGLSDAQLFDAYAQAFAGFTRLLLDDRGRFVGLRTAAAPVVDALDQVTR